jgi:hypothetical protein
MVWRAGEKAGLWFSRLRLNAEGRHDDIRLCRYLRLGGIDRMGSGRDDSAWQVVNMTAHGSGKPPNANATKKDKPVANAMPSQTATA